MPSRRSETRATKEREERKKRQEKFRKRTKSLFNKTKLLARDTDAWVALIVRDRAGRVQSIRSSGSRYWPPSIQDLVKAHPTGVHEYFEKQDISGWKEVTGDANDTILDHSEVDSADGGVQTSIVPEEDPDPDNTMAIGQYDMDRSIESGRSLSGDGPNEHVAEDLAAVDHALAADHSSTAESLPASSTFTMDLLRSKNTQVSQPMELDSPSADVEQVQDIDATHTTREAENSKVDPSEVVTVVDADMPAHTTFKLGELGDMIMEPKAVESHNLMAHNSGVEVPSKDVTTDTLSATDTDLPTSDYDFMTDFDIPRPESSIQVDDKGEASSAVSTIAQNPESLSTRVSGGWQVVNWPKTDPKGLLRSWNWVFQARRYP